MNIIKLTPIKVGPWGSDSGNAFDFNKEGDFVMKKITVRYGAVIDSLTFEYEYNGKTETVSYGGAGGANVNTLSLDSTGDLIKIAGTYGQFQDEVVIISLSFVTTSRTYGPYGNPRATGTTNFEMPTEGGKIVGFHGKYDDFVTAIGAYLVCAYV